MTRISNRIWSVCSRKGYKLPIKGGKAKTATLRAMIPETGIGGFAKEQLETLLDDYDRLVARKEALSKRKMRRDAADFTNRLTEREGRK